MDVSTDYQTSFEKLSELIKTSGTKNPITHTVHYIFKSIIKKIQNDNVMISDLNLRLNILETESATLKDNLQVTSDQLKLDLVTIKEDLSNNINDTQELQDQYIKVLKNAHDAMEKLLV